MSPSSSRARPDSTTFPTRGRWAETTYFGAARAPRPAAARIPTSMTAPMMGNGHGRASSTAPPAPSTRNRAMAAAWAARPPDNMLGEASTGAHHGAPGFTIARCSGPSTPTNGPPTITGAYGGAWSVAAEEVHHGVADLGQRGRIQRDVGHIRDLDVLGVGNPIGRLAEQGRREEGVPLVGDHQARHRHAGQLVEMVLLAPGHVGLDLAEPAGFSPRAEYGVDHVEGGPHHVVVPLLGRGQHGVEHVGPVGEVGGRWAGPEGSRDRAGADVGGLAEVAAADDQRGGPDQVGTA